MRCPDICIREQQPRDPASLGVVASNEDIYRGFFPSDRNTSGVKPSAISAQRLWDGELSVWRSCELVGLNVQQLVAFIEPLMVRGKGERFDELRAAPAAEIRNHEVEGVGQRSFSILDDCVYDNAGNKHPAHAHIAICERLKAEIQFKDVTFLALQAGLKLLFESGHEAWRRR